MFLRVLFTDSFGSPYPHSKWCHSTEYPIQPRSTQTGNNSPSLKSSCECISSHVADCVFISQAAEGRQQQQQQQRRRPAETSPPRRQGAESARRERREKKRRVQRTAMMRCGRFMGAKMKWRLHTYQRYNSPYNHNKYPWVGNSCSLLVDTICR